MSEEEDAKVTPPKEALINGAQILQQSLGPYGFQFQFREDGKGSGGAFAWGEFIRGERKIELHFRFTLGMVRYHIDDQSASHESYMRELNVWSQCHYPGFSEDAADGFRELTHDLAFANDFLCGDAAVLRNAAAKEALKTAKLDQQIMAASVGDVRKLEEMRDHFRGGRYGEVIRLAAELKYPNQMRSTEQQMVKLAGEKAKSHHAAKSH
jgi:hypothetical protein